MICHIIGARPNFMKCVPLYRELEKRGQEQKIIHSGQHYDYNMSGVFLEEFGITPDVNLEVKAGSHGATVGTMMVRLEYTLKTLRPDHVIVYGDVNTTLAGALVAAKMNIPLHHVEAGLRSRDTTMPEEINRIVVDSVSDYLYAPTYNDSLNARLSEKWIKAINVGNIMIDCIEMFSDKIIDPEATGYVFVTLHRPSNVDDPKRLSKIITHLKQLDFVIFPAHPRIKNLNIDTVRPVSYFESLGFQKGADLVITDSGGVQVESAYFGTPCLVVRDTSEWKFSTLVGPEELDKKPEPVVLPPMWDGKTAQRIADVICG